MSDFQLSVLCLVVTLVLYFANKRLYRRFHKLPLMPLKAHGVDLTNRKRPLPLRVMPPLTPLRC